MTGKILQVSFALLNQFPSKTDPYCVDQCQGLLIQSTLEWTIIKYFEQAFYNKSYVFMELLNADRVFRNPLYQKFPIT